MVHFLLGGNDMDDVDDEINQDDGHEDIDEAIDIRGIFALGQQKSF